MTHRIEHLPNNRYRVETIGAGMGETFRTLADALAEAKRRVENAGGTVVMI